jgi:hypothetical protein
MTLAANYAPDERAAPDESAVDTASQQEDHRAGTTADRAARDAQG